MKKAFICLLGMVVSVLFLTESVRAQCVFKPVNVELNYGRIPTTFSSLTMEQFKYMVKNPSHLQSSYNFKNGFSGYNETPAIKRYFGFGIGFLPFSKNENKFVKQMELRIGLNYTDLLTGRIYESYYDTAMPGNGTSTNDTIIGYSNFRLEKFDRCLLNVSLLSGTNSSRRFSLQAGIGLHAGTSLQHYVNETVEKRTQIGIDLWSFSGNVLLYTDSLKEFNKVPMYPIFTGLLDLPLTINFRILKQLSIQFKLAVGIAFHTTKNTDMHDYTNSKTYLNYYIPPDNTYFVPPKYNYSYSYFSRAIGLRYQF